MPAEAHRVKGANLLKISKLEDFIKDWMSILLVKRLEEESPCRMESLQRHELPERKSMPLPEKSKPVKKGVER